MSCVTYVDNLPTNIDRFMFGSTFTAESQGVGTNNNVAEARRNLLDTWRRRLMSSALLASSAVHGLGQLIGPFSPYLTKQLAV